ncbi:GNAT family N-acetyltransferase [Pseudonocardia sp. TRM90224]|uniref:GNAT family N-acetyltransferase n=1 Tax=Pseudonocardia sp. TRM90224 TaxID=2812678 RepID=UPI001E2A553A|nr:GNAT family N-acetyltransferase [Pseudonocardia sp. TRM90224]
MATGDEFEIRDAQPHDGPELTALVRESAAYTGEYQAMVARQVVDEAYMAANPTRVCVDGETIVGFASLLVPGRGVAGEAELDFMFVANDQQRRGIGRILMDDVVALARRTGIRRIHIVSHPPSESFYRAVGAVPAGEIPPSGGTTWARPLLLLDFEP